MKRTVTVVAMIAAFLLTSCSKATDPVSDMANELEAAGLTPAGKTIPEYADLIREACAKTETVNQFTAAMLKDSGDDRVLDAMRIGFRHLCPDKEHQLD